MSERFKVVTIAHGSEPPRQFVIAVGEVFVVGRAPDCDLVADLRGVSGRHAELSVVEGGPDGCAELRIRDVSTNGTGTSIPGQNGALEHRWVPLRQGQSRALGSPSQVLLPFNRKSKVPREEVTAVFTLRVVGESLPDAYDTRRGVGRWCYHAKLGEGALGIVFRASDASGRLAEEVAVKVSKINKTAKRGAQLRHAYILHREAQWSLQRLHNARSSRFCPRRAAHFARYLEDHTGRWAAPNLDFEAERSVFEAADFRWDSYRPSSAMPACPYVVMELVPGRTLHQAMGWSSEPGEDPPLSTEEKAALTRQLAEALEYLAGFGLIHRDFRTTNLLLVGRGHVGRVKVIDLGHTIAAEPEHVRNRSAVVRCSWKESTVKHFDWAPLEVKDQSILVNFAFPTHAFDVYSLGVLILQLELCSIREARALASRLAAAGAGGAALHAGAPVAPGALGYEGELIGRMLGSAAGRPRPDEVLHVLHNTQRLREKRLQYAPPLPAPRTGAEEELGRDRSRTRSRARSRTRSRGRPDGGAGAAASSAERPRWRSLPEVEVVDDGYDVWSPDAVAYGSATETEGSATDVG